MLAGTSSAGRQMTDFMSPLVQEGVLSARRRPGHCRQCEWGTGLCLIILQCPGMNVDNGYIHSGINILRVHLFLSLSSLFLILHFLFHRLRVLCPWLCLKQIYENVCIIFPLVRDCQDRLPVQHWWSRIKHSLSSLCRAPYNHLWAAFKQGNLVSYTSLKAALHCY